MKTNLIQKYTSKDTSINVVNKIYTHYDFIEGSHILDYGGGKYDKNIEYMKNKNSFVYVYDKYNRSKDYNATTKGICSKRPPDYIVCSNVLNVIYEDEIIEEILEDIYLYAENAIVLFAIYEGDKSGIGKETTKGYQRNQKIKEYLKYIEEYFEVIKIKKGIIECRRKDYDEKSSESDVCT